MTLSGPCLGAILAITLALIAWFAWRRWRRPRPDRFTYATPATPLVREAAGELFASLHQVSVLGRGLDCLPAPARAGAAGTVAVIERAASTLKSAPATYANYLAVYRGLACSDRALLCAADAYTRAGFGVHQDIAAAAMAAAGPGPASDAANAETGNTLIALGQQLRCVVADVHRLGVALDVE